MAQTGDMRLTLGLLLHNTLAHIRLDTPPFADPAYCYGRHDFVIGLR